MYRYITCMIATTYNCWLHYEDQVALLILRVNIPGDMPGKHALQFGKSQSPHFCSGKIMSDRLLFIVLCKHGEVYLGKPKQLHNLLCMLPLFVQKDSTINTLVKNGQRIFKRQVSIG